MKPRHLRALRDDLIRELNLDSSATTETVCLRLCEVVAQRQQREIRLRFDDLGAGLSGLWAVTDDDVHVVIVTTARSWVHRLLILLHEIAHMLCGHQPMQLSTGEANALFYPDLSPDMLRVLAGRTTLSRDEEREADQVAGALTQGLIDWAQRQEVRPFEPGRDDLATRAWYTLGYTPRGHHG
ncbi:hypothetical protein GCM10010171_62960 [Actinokineospora fastidiosa]|uniref:IrrE N-terminal-like domain-containing protein n=2 Tax=Actinokineospora fastidiosa TaxID=1816 RepID=A0A918LJP8_9PSEU|nr:hypothetical protein GCM10010171_62960 [Actinokineospora fastidiosa]